MDKAQKQLIQTYYRKRNIGAQQSKTYKFKPYEYSKFAVENNLINFNDLPISELHDMYLTNYEMKDYVKPLIDNYNKNTQGLLRLVTDQDYDGLYNFIASSHLYDNTEKKPEVTNLDIDLNLDENEIISALDLDDYKYVYSTAYSSYYDTASDDTADYMYNYLNNTNKNLINDIASAVNYPDDIYVDNLTKFLEEFGMDGIISDFLSYLSEAENDAKVKAAQEQLKNFPIDIDDNSKIYYHKLLSYLYEYNLKNVKSFDEFITFLSDNNVINDDSIYEEAHEYENFDDLNYNINNSLNGIFDDIKNNPDSEYYQYAQGVKEINNLLTKLGFTFKKDLNTYAYRKQSDKVIHVKELRFDEKDNKFKIYVILIYNDGKQRQGWILPEQLKNYVDQKEIEGLKQ